MPTPLEDRSPVTVLPWQGRHPYLATGESNCAGRFPGLRRHLHCGNARDSIIAGLVMVSALTSEVQEARVLFITIVLQCSPAVTKKK